MLYDMQGGLAMVSQSQADKATAICDRMLETIAKLQADFASLKSASDDFQKEFAVKYPHLVRSNQP